MSLRGIEAYYRPATLEEAWLMLDAAPGARLVAGGTDLVPKLRDGRVRAPALVSLGRVEELRGVDAGPPWRIGALVRIAELAEDARLAAALPVLVEGARALGSEQVRSLATVGGNLCNASPCADLAPPLLVHDARVRIRSRAETREVPLEDFFVAPGKTRLGPGEVLVAILVDPPPAGTRATFLKKGRVAMDIAVASVAVSLRVEGGVIVHARVAAGSVAPRPVRLHEVERLLQGRAPGAETAAEARRVAEREVAPISDLRATEAYRRRLAGVLVERAVRSCG